MIVVLANNPEINVEKIARKIARHILNIPALTHMPVVLSKASLNKAAGTYITEDGVSAEIIYVEEQLTLQSPFECSLIPISESAYYVSQDDEFEVHFSDEQDGVFNVLTLHMPIPHRFKAIRKQS